MARSNSRVTSFDVAALAGVSQSAVSRAFTPGSSIAEETKAKIFEAARKLNYVPNSIASSLTTNRSNIVALILGDLENPFYVHVLRAFSQKLQEQGQQVLTFTLGPGVTSDDAIMQVLRYQVDGVILTSASLSTRMTGICHDRGIPIVLFNRYIPQGDTMSVRCDNEGGGRMMAETMLAAGASRFALIIGDPNGTTSQDRARGFTERLMESGVRRGDIHPFEGGSSYEGGALAAQKIMQLSQHPDAVFAVSDIMAMGAMDVLQKQYLLNVPADIMIAGFDGIPEASRLPYELTTIRTPVDEMVLETLRVLQQSIGNDDPAECVSTPFGGKLIMGRSLRTLSSASL